MDWEKRTHGFGTAAAKAPSTESDMHEEKLEGISEIVNTLQDEKRRILAAIDTLPDPPNKESHASVAILEGWADGLIDDSFVEEYIEKYKNCVICRQNYDFYKKLRKNNRQGLIS